MGKRTIIIGTLLFITLIIVASFGYLDLKEEKQATYYDREIKSYSSLGDPIYKSNSLTQEQETALLNTLSQWEYNGTEVYFEDNKTLITAEDNSSTPTISFTPKTFTGNITVAVGIGSRDWSLESIGYNKHKENLTVEYTCEESFNYTTNPKHFWCFIEHNNGTHTPILDHSFEGGNLQIKTAYWYHEHEVWDEVIGKVQKTTFKVGDVDTWYYKKNFAVTAGTEYEMKLDLKPKSIRNPRTKYWVAFWPSSLTIKEAIQQDKFYALDPWTADLNTDLVAYYKFDSDAPFEDKVNGYNGTNTATTNASGIIIDSRDYGNGNDYITVADTADLDFGNGDFTSNFWVKTTDATYPTFWGKAIGGTPYTGVNIRLLNTGLVRVTVDNADRALGTSSVIDGAWHMITITKNSTDVYAVYVDGVLENSGVPYTSDVDTTTDLRFGHQLTWGNYLDNGQIDEAGFWKGRALSQSDITQLYNGGAGISYTNDFDSSPNVTLHYPTNNSAFTSSPITFNCTVWDDVNLTSVSLLIDGSVDQTNTSGINNSVYTFTKNLGTGDYNWTCRGTDNDSQSTTPTALLFNVTITAPSVTLQSPIPYYNATSNTNNFIAFVTSPDPLVNVSLVQNGTVITSLTNSSTTNNTNYTFSGAFPDGTHTWSVQACDDDGECVSDASRTINIDTLDPSISLTAPTNTSIINIGEVFNLNWTVSDTNLDTCWYQYNNTNTTVTCGSNTTTFNYVPPYTSLIFYANDSFGNEASVPWDWTATVIVTEETYSESTVETSNENFQIDINYNSSAFTGVSTDFTYITTDYTTTQIGTGDDIIFNRSINIPTVTATINNSLYWTISLTNSSGTFDFTTDTRNQTVTKVNFTLCNYSEGPQLYFKTYDAAIPSNAINATFQSSWRFSEVSGGTIVVNASYQDLTETMSEWGFCISPNSSNYTVSVDVQVDASNYTITNHYIVDSDYDSTGDNISLYLNPDNTSTLTQLIVNDQDNQPLSNIYVNIQRYDVGTDTYYNVGMARTDTAGSDLVYLVWYDEWYVFTFTQNGEVIGTNGPRKISATPVTFKIGTTGGSEYEKFKDVSYNLYFNETTNNFVLTYTTTSGEISNSCLKTIKRNATADYLICETCESSTSATLYCNIASAGNGTFITQFYQTGSPFYVINFLVHVEGIQNEFYELIGNDDGTGMAIIFAGVILTLFLISPALAILGGILGMWGAVAVGFQPLDYVSFLGITAIGILLMSVMKK